MLQEFLFYDDLCVCMSSTGAAAYKSGVFFPNLFIIYLFIYIFLFKFLLQYLKFVNKMKFNTT